MQRVKTPAEFDRGAGSLRFLRQISGSSAPLDDQVRMFQGNSSGAAVGKKLEAAYLVDDAAFGDSVRAGCACGE